MVCKCYCCKQDLTIDDFVAHAESGRMYHLECLNKFVREFMSISGTAVEPKQLHKNKTKLMKNGRKENNYK